MSGREPRAAGLAKGFRNCPGLQCSSCGVAPPPEVPWQIAGVPFGASEYVVRGSPAQDKFAVFHLLGDRVLAVEAVNAVPEFMIGGFHGKPESVFPRNPRFTFEEAGRFA